MIEPLPPANHSSIHSRILLFIKIHLERIGLHLLKKNIRSMISSQLVIPCLLFYILHMNHIMYVNCTLCTIRRLSNEKEN